MRFGWGRGFYTAIPVPKLDILNPPSTKVTLPAGATYTFAITGLVTLWLSTGYPYYLNLEAYDGSVWGLVGTLGGAITFGSWHSFLSLANNVRVYNGQTISISIVFAIVSPIVVSYKVVSIPPGGVYVVEDVGLVTIRPRDNVTESWIQVYDGTTWNTVYYCGLFFSNGSNVRCYNPGTTYPVTVVILVGVIK